MAPNPDGFQPGGRALCLPGVSGEQCVRSLVPVLARELGELDADRASALLNLAIIASVNHVGRAALRAGLLAWFDEQDGLEGRSKS